MKNDTYGEPEIIQGNNIVAKVYSPILTDEERERRRDGIKQAAVRLVLSEKKRKERQNEQQNTRQSVRS
jgi:hypothetical protein